MKASLLRHLPKLAVPFVLMAAGCSEKPVVEEPIKTSTVKQNLPYTPNGPGLGNLTYNAGELWNRIALIDKNNFLPVDFPGLNQMYMFNGYGVGVASFDHGWHGGEVEVFDLSDPRNISKPTSVYDAVACYNYCDERGHLTGDLREMHGAGFSIMNGNWYMVMPAGHGIEIWDFTNVGPGSPPNRVSKFDIPGITGGDYGNSAWQLVWQAPYIYVSHGDQGISTIDASDPFNPVLLSSTPTSQTGGFRVGPIFAMGNLMVISSMDTAGSMATLDISNPANPQLIDTYNSTETFYAICFNGENVVFTERGGGADMQIASVANPSNIAQLENDTVTNPESLYCAMQGDLVAMGNQEEVAYYNISDPANPAFAGQGNLGVGSGSDHGQVMFMGNITYVGNDHGSGSGFLVHQTAPDTAPPRVQHVNPKDGTTVQSTQTRIGVAFSDNILIESLDTSTFIVREQGGSALPGTYSGQQAIVNFTPQNQLERGKTYEIVIPVNGVSDWAGNLTDQQFISTFTVSGGGSNGGDGVGLKGEYYTGMNFETLTMTRTDATVGFQWGNASPGGGVPDNGFSVRWTGSVKADFNETYTFYGNSDDGQRLWVNGVQLINQWVDQGPTESSGTIALQAGQTYDITYEYYENGGGAVAELRWSSPSIAKQVIPMEKLYPPGSICTPDCSGKQCGDDGCGGSCGSCSAGNTCDPAQQCVASGGTTPPGEGWVECSNENGTCSFTGLKEVAYGGSGAWNYGNYTGGVSCNNATFGDPAPGVSKKCFYRDINQDVLLTGTQFGCCGEWSPGSGFQNALDGNTGTFFDAASGNGNYAGLDLGTAQALTKVRYWPRDGMGSRMVGGKFQGSNTSSTSGYTDLHTVSAPVEGQWNEVTLTGNSYRYVRYLSPDAGFGNVNELEFYSSSGITPVTASMASSGAATVGSSVTFTATGAGGSGTLQYSFDFQDGSAPTGFSPSNTVSHTFNSAGHYPVVVTVRDSEGVTANANILQTIHKALTANRPTKSGSIALEDTTEDRIYVVNTDNDTLTKINASTLAKEWEVAVGDEPTTVAYMGADYLVANHGSDTISRIRWDGTTVATYNMPRGSQPFGVVLDPAGSNAYVTLEGTGRLLRMNPADGSITGDISVGPRPRGIAVSADGSSIYVTRFISAANVAEVRKVSASTFSVTNTINLQMDSTTVDVQDAGGGLPNYLVNIAISPDGQRAFLPSQKTNTDRGQFVSGENLTFDSTVRGIISQIDLGSNSEDFGAQNDIDNINLPMDVAFMPLGDYYFVAHEANNRVDMIDAYSGAELLQLNTDRAPKGLVMNPEGTRLFVHNFMGRSVQVFDTSTIANGSNLTAAQLGNISTVANESLSAQVLTGKKIFYNAADSRMALDSYLTCASCHLDGHSDGRVWDFTDRGEGFRYTRSMKGMGNAGGMFHWTANFDELQDFENDIRNGFGGTGLMSDADFNAGTRSNPLGDPKAGLSSDLDALVAYINSLTTMPKSPYRNQDGSMTASAVAGQAVYESQNCASCHSGAYFTDNQRHDVGTIQANSGQGIGAPLAGVGFDTPTLLGLYMKDKFLHNGQAATLSAVLNSSSHGGTNGLSAQQRSDLEQFLLQIEPGTANNGSGGGGGSGSVTVRAYLGAGSSDTITLRLDDVDVQTWTINATPTDYTYNGATGTKNVKVYFPDNGTDAVIDYIVVNGNTTLQGEDQATNTGVWANDACGGAGFSEWLHCAGYIDFGSVNFGSAPGTGLKGDYYNGMNFETFVLSRTDSTVNFNWGGSPASGVNADGFSVRWTGKVKPEYSETYTFYGASDDGQRLWVNGTQLINNWVDQGVTENSGTITLSAGVQYDITYEYYENGGGAEAYLSWSSPSVAKQIIPMANLYPAGGSTCTFSVVPNGDNWAYAREFVINGTTVMYTDPAVTNNGYTVHGGGWLETQSTSASVSIDFTGTLVMRTQKPDWGGSSTAYVDGVNVGTVSHYSAGGNNDVLFDVFTANCP